MSPTFNLLVWKRRNEQFHAADSAQFIKFHEIKDQYISFSPPEIGVDPHKRPDEYAIEAERQPARPMHMAAQAYIQLLHNKRMSIVWLGTTLVGSLLTSWLFPFLPPAESTRLLLLYRRHNAKWRRAHHGRPQ